jgi:BirA family biotin operon repressor/biotin-[acetyl-CoA-carboxylase] ligase
MATDPLRGPWLARRLAPAHVHVFARLRSTNDYAARAVEDGDLKPPALIAASRQTAGRGQHTNTWWSDAGSLCVTFVLPADPAMPLGQVPLRAGLAVAEVVAHCLPRARVQVKWPNDVFVDGRKIAGLLCLRRRDADLIGIGLNVTTDLRHAPRPVRVLATSLHQHTRNPPRRDDVLCRVWTSVLAWRIGETWREAYDQRHRLHNQRIAVTSAQITRHGICRGIDHHGRLLLDAGGDLVGFTDGSVTSTGT